MKPSETTILAYPCAARANARGAGPRRRAAARAISRALPAAAGPAAAAPVRVEGGGGPDGRPVRGLGRRRQDHHHPPAGGAARSARLSRPPGLAPLGPGAALSLAVALP